MSGAGGRVLRATEDRDRVTSDVMRQLFAY
jgi:hypothetical protein